MPSIVESHGVGDESCKEFGDGKRGLLLRVLEGTVRLLLGGTIKLSLLTFRKTDNDIIRHSMYESLRKVFASTKVSSGSLRVLSISGSTHLAQMVCSGSDSTVVEADYPEVSIFSIPYPDESFDVVVSDQVFEHIEGDPFDAMAETFRVLKKGGLVVHTTVLLFQIHGYPSDYWRFTPDGLRLLCRGQGDVLNCGGWGNRYVWFLNWLGVIYGENVPVAVWHPYSWIARFNEWRYPVVTWVVARKAGVSSEA